MALQNTAFINQMKADYPDVNTDDYGVFLIPLG